MMNVEQAIKLVQLLNTDGAQSETSTAARADHHGPWRIGQAYVVRTITMIQVGKLVAVYPQELVLESAAWVADTGRWTDFLTGGTALEVEPFPNGPVVVGRGSIVDACLWRNDLLRDQI